MLLLHRKSLVDFGSVKADEGVDMNSRQLKTVLQSAGAVTVVSVLVSIVGAGTKWMGN